MIVASKRYRHPRTCASCHSCSARETGRSSKSHPQITEATLGQAGIEPPTVMMKEACQNGRMRVAMVCLGNICRSPMAAAVATAMAEDAGLGGEVVFESFGTAGYHEGECANPRADATLRRGGWPAGGHRARQLRPADLAAADLVLCADRSNLADVRRLAGAGAGTAKVRLLRSYDPEASPGDDEVPDPWGGDDTDFDLTLALIEQACRGLVGELADAPR